LSKTVLIDGPFVALFT